MSNQPVQVQILGRTIKVNCPTGEEDALIAAAKDFDQRLHQLSERTKVTNTEQLLIIAALNACHDLQTAKKEAQGYFSQVNQRMQLLSNTLEKALIQQGQQ
ncbi:cell division protein ZapA [Vibrio sp. Of7-15]|uniref:cell division protein ZapA n=1 Tax=Vibrio sp. Of7-15 TaxID=2724879 RepID=UPI001EF3286B|nr:cell division protein ZapA [Vibrio sp. Of7-15]MCG7499050.1 cell division protein ZapA [Vibrio sp. Of7-15]